VKSSLDYTELAGLKIALIHAKLDNAPSAVLDWLSDRIKFLETK
jgi:hypothetical protein